MDDAELARLYAYGPKDAPCVRVNFITSIDGAISIRGRSGGLGGPGDKRIFTLLRELADVIIVGAGTVRAEDYGGARVSEAVRSARASAGQEPVPRIGVVTSSAHLAPESRLFRDTAVPPLVITGREAHPARIAALRAAGAEVVSLAPQDSGTPPLAALPALLAGMGYRRILCEGGPGLTGRALEAGIVDEVCLTTAPLLVGGGAGRMASSDTVAETPMRLQHLLTDPAGALYARWRVERVEHGR